MLLSVVPFLTSDMITALYRMPTHKYCQSSGFENRRRKSVNFQETYQRKITFIGNSHFNYLLREPILMNKSLWFSLLVWRYCASVYLDNWRIVNKVWRWPIFREFLRHWPCSLNSNPAFMRCPFKNQTLRLVHEAPEPHCYQSDQTFHHLFQPVSCNINRIVPHVTIPALFIGHSSSVIGLL